MAKPIQFWPEEQALGLYKKRLEDNLNYKNKVFEYKIQKIEYKLRELLNLNAFCNGRLQCLSRGCSHESLVNTIKKLDKVPIKEINIYKKRIKADYKILVECMGLEEEYLQIKDHNDLLLNKVIEEAHWLYHKYPREIYSIDQKIGVPKSLVIAEGLANENQTTKGWYVYYKSPEESDSILRDLIH